MKSTSTGNISDEVATILVDVGCVIFRPRQPFKFDSGIISPVYVDNRLLISRTQERKSVIEYLTQKIKKTGNFDIIAGTATAGIPHAAWISDRLNLPMVYVRSAPKEHGRGTQVEGSTKRGDKVLVVEDMVSTAGSSLRVIDALRKLGADVTDEIAIYTHGLSESYQNFKKAKIRFHYLTDLENVIKIAVEKGFLKSEHASVIKSWAEDPKNWARKIGFS